MSAGAPELTRKDELKPENCETPGDPCRGTVKILCGDQSAGLAAGTVASVARLQILVQIRSGDRIASKMNTEMKWTAVKCRRIEKNRRGVIMPSVHYETIAAYLIENIELLSDTSADVKPENKPLWNISHALLTLSDALKDEFVYIDTRLGNIEQRVNS